VSVAASLHRNRRAWRVAAAPLQHARNVEIGGFVGCSVGAPKRPAQPVCDCPKAHIWSRIGPVFARLFHIKNIVDMTEKLSHFDTALYQNSSMNKKA
jgi:hypothetical protein